MSDKDMTERNVMKEQFLQANLLICLFHTMRTFQREILCEKLGISQGERVLCLELLSKMTYAQNEAEYTVFMINSSKVLLRMLRITLMETGMVFMNSG